jgi:hypothetical protein
MTSVLDQITKAQEKAKNTPVPLKDTNNRSKQESER